MCPDREANGDRQSSGLRELPVVGDDIALLLTDVSQDVECPRGGNPSQAAIVLLAATTMYAGWESATHYFNGTVNYTEPLFVVVIMALTSTRPVISFAESALRRVSAAERPQDFLRPRQNPRGTTELNA